MPDKIVQSQYVNAGKTIGDVLSYIYMGKCIDFDAFFNDWKRWEAEYARRGFRTVSADRFVAAGGYGESLEGLLGKKREANEAPVFHAEILERDYLSLIPEEGIGSIAVRTKG